ncbi:Similar to Hemocytin (Bombyx mori) [Cotesia congregata]|uniref:Similar to Hemocytin (Bombyx mori) n=1 Tax=Cotesia congregata TaxID=51543 RepID=A0A8J2HRP4_COTCN|nr:Similar to Hemocytin (Bombyx mori) [Cotesia congregata]
MSIRRHSRNNKTESHAAKIGEKWIKGLCEYCVCEKSTDIIPKSTCTKIQCSKIDDHSDSKNYKLKEVTVEGHCCPRMERVACKHQDKFYNVGEKCQSEDFCTNYECIYNNQSLRIKESITKCEKVDLLEEEKYEIKTEKIAGQCCPACITEECLNKTGKIELVQTVRTCNQDCKLGWEYRDPKEGECCGECEQTYCIENGILHQINMPPGYLMIIARLIFVRLNTAIR